MIWLIFLKTSYGALRGKILLASQVEAFCALCLLSFTPCSLNGLLPLRHSPKVTPWTAAASIALWRPQTQDCPSKSFPPTCWLLQFPKLPSKEARGLLHFSPGVLPSPETSFPLCCPLIEATLHIWIDRGITYPHPRADSGHVHLGRGSLTQKGACGLCWTSGQKDLDLTDMHPDELKPGCIVNPLGHLLVPAILSPVGQWNRWWHVRWMDRWTDAQVGR